MVRKMHAKVHNNKRITKIIIRFYLLKKLFLGDFDFIDHRLYNIDQLLPHFFHLIIKEKSHPKATLYVNLTGCLARCDPEKDNGRLRIRNLPFLFYIGIRLIGLFHHHFNSLFSYLHYSYGTWQYAGGNGSYVVLTDG